VTERGFNVLVVVVSEALPGDAMDDIDTLVGSERGSSRDLFVTSKTKANFLEVSHVVADDDNDDDGSFLAAHSSNSLSDEASVDEGALGGKKSLKASVDRQRFSVGRRRLGACGKSADG
jgi:hypothetical protein